MANMQITYNGKLVKYVRRKDAPQTYDVWVGGQSARCLVQHHPSAEHRWASAMTMEVLKRRIVRGPFYRHRHLAVIAVLQEVEKSNVPRSAVRYGPENMPQ